MAKYVELIGAPGIGKSSCYQHLNMLHKTSDHWISLNKLIKTSMHTAPKGAGEKVKLIIKKLVGIHKYRSDFDFKLTDRYATSNTAFMELFWKIMPQQNDIFGKDHRFLMVTYFLMIIQKTQLVKEIQSEKCAIIDESLTNASITYLANYAPAAEMEQQLLQIIDTISLPAGYIIFGGSLEVIMKRTQNRGYLIPSDGLLTTEALKRSRMEFMEKLAIFHKCLGVRNIPCLYLEAEESVALKSRKIIEFVKALN